MDLEVALKVGADGDGQRRLNTTKGTELGDPAGQRPGNRKA